MIRRVGRVKPCTCRDLSGECVAALLELGRVAPGSRRPLLFFYTPGCLAHFIASVHVVAVLVFCRARPQRYRNNSETKFTIILGMFESVDAGPNKETMNLFFVFAKPQVASGLVLFRHVLLLSTARHRFWAPTYNRPTGSHLL